MKTIISYTDSIRTCESCGKTNLKGTFLLVDEYNNEFYYGSECGARAAGISKSEFKEKSNIDHLLKSVVSEAWDMGLGWSLEDNVQKVILKRKLRLPISNPYFKKKFNLNFRLKT